MVDIYWSNLEFKNISNLLFFLRNDHTGIRHVISFNWLMSMSNSSVIYIMIVFVGYLKALIDYAKKKIIKKKNKIPSRNKRFQCRFHFLLSYWWVSLPNFSCILSSIPPPFLSWIYIFLYIALYTQIKIQRWKKKQSLL